MGCSASVCRTSLRNLRRQLWYLIRTPKAIRMIVLGVALVIYVKMRSFLAVDQLVRIYREVSWQLGVCMMPHKRAASQASMLLLALCLYLQ